MSILIPYMIFIITEKGRNILMSQDLFLLTLHIPEKGNI
jgi:hypothetical protein